MRNRKTVWIDASAVVRKILTKCLVSVLALLLVTVGSTSVRATESVDTGREQSEMQRPLPVSAPSVDLPEKPSATSSEFSAQSSQKSGPLKVLFLYVGPIGDGGWTFSHEKARHELMRRYGERIQTTYVENVPESDVAFGVLRDGVISGNTLIFGTSFGYMEPMLKASQWFKGVKFEHVSGYKRADNMRTYDSRTYEGAYMAGVIAGKMTKTGTLGVVASIPIPEVIRNINSFTLGAQSSNPKVKTKVVWVDAWFDQTKEAIATERLIDDGADILFQNTESPAVLQAAQEKGKRAFGWNSDMTAYAPKAHLASSVINWGPYYVKATQDALDGTWTTGDRWWGVKEGAVDLVSLAPDVPATTRSKIEQIKAGLKKGSFVIWKGPILDTAGKVVLKRGEIANDVFLSRMSFYVLGVEGKVPGSK
jgi:basic membrane protein A